MKCREGLHWKWAQAQLCVVSRLEPAPADFLLYTVGLGGIICVSHLGYCGTRSRAVHGSKAHTVSMIRQYAEVHGPPASQRLV